MPRILPLLALALLASPALAEDLPDLPQPGAAPAVAPAPAMTATAPAAGPVDPKAVATLELLEKRDKTLKNFSATFIKRDDNLRTLDEESRDGTMVYVKGKTGDKDVTKFSVRLTKVRIKGMGARALQQDLIFDGAWLTDISVEGNQKNFKKTELVPPGTTMNPMELGGPLPIPIGQDTKQILRDFEVTLLPADSKADPKASADLTHLKLVPRDPKQWRYKQIDLWVDPRPEVELPVQVRTVTPDMRTTVTLTDIKINQPSTPDITTPEVPKAGTGWNVVINRYAPPETKSPATAPATPGR